MKTQLIYGSIGGLTLVLFHFARYLIDPMWVLGEHMFTVLFINLSIMCLIPILSMRSWKRQTGENATYGIALKYIFLCMITASTISVLYEGIFDYIKKADLALENEARVKVMIKRQSEWPYLLGYRMSGASEAEMAEMREKLALDDSRNEEIEKRWQEYLEKYNSSLSNIFLEILLSAIFLLPLSMLVALLVRSRKPRNGIDPKVPATDP